jgi:hypothetical protein
MSEVDNITKQTFDKNLAMIAPCGDQNSTFEESEVISSVVHHSVKLHPTYGFCWEREDVSEPSSVDGVPPPTGWDNQEGYSD